MGSSRPLTYSIWRCGFLSWNSWGYKGDFSFGAINSMSVTLNYLDVNTTQICFKLNNGLTLEKRTMYLYSLEFNQSMRTPGFNLTPRPRLN